MSKANNQHLTSSNGRLLLIVGLVMMVRLVRPDEAGQQLIDDAIAALADDDIITAADDQQQQQEQDKSAMAATIYLNAIRELQAIKESKNQQQDSPASILLNKRKEAEPIGVSQRTGSVSPLYRRSALNKNFIRFGRSGYKARQTQTVINRADDDLSESDDDGLVRESRSLNSNFIRFGRRSNFFPSNKWAETLSRFARTPSGHHRMLVDSFRPRRSADVN